MPANEYHFTTYWRVRATPEEVYEILKDPSELPRWWPAVYLDVTELDDVEGNDSANGTAGDDHDGAGESVYDLYTTGWLPYTLRWQAYPGDRDRPHRIELDARGDLVGNGVWTLAQDGAWTEITYDWNIRANKPLLRRFSWLIRPIFAANHHWAMDTGEESLRRELARRRAPPDGDARRPAPPQPTSTSPSMSPLALMAGLLCVGLLLYVCWRTIHQFGSRRFFS